MASPPLAHKRPRPPEPAAAVPIASLPSAASSSSPAPAPPARLPPMDACNVCRASSGSDKLVRKHLVLRLDPYFDPQSRALQPLTWEQAQAQHAALLAGVEQRAFEQDMRDLSHLRCRRSPTDPTWQALLAQQERQLEGFHFCHHRGWGELGRHRNHKVVFATDARMAAVLIDTYGTHRLEPPPPTPAAGAEGKQPPRGTGSGGGKGSGGAEGFGSQGRLVPKGLSAEEAGKRPIVYEPAWHPIIHPLTACAAVFGEKVAREVEPIMMSANFQHFNIQFHQDQAAEGDGHGSRIATLCLRRPAEIQFHSYVTHLTYAFTVYSGDVWGFSGPLLFEEGRDGEAAWSWAHGVEVAEGKQATPGQHHAECRDCRISLNYRLLDHGSTQPAMTRRAMASKAPVEKEEAKAGEGVVGLEEQEQGGGRVKGVAAGVGGGGKGKRTRTR